MNRPICLEIIPEADSTRVLAGLEDWVDCGLLQDAQVHLTFEGGAVQRLSITLAQPDAAIMHGLDQWLDQSLISETTVLNLARSQFSCPLNATPVPLPSRRSAEAVREYQDTPLSTPIPSLRSKVIAYALWCLCFVGLAGVHRLYTGSYGLGLLWLLTFGLFGVGQLLDLALIPSLVDRFNQQRQRLITTQQRLSGDAALAAGDTLVDQTDEWLHNPPAWTSPNAPVPQLPVRVSDPSLSPPPLPEPPTPRRRVAPIGVAQVLHSLMTELSVVWLLFLGVFLLVVSSGILAVTQWRNFPPTGQFLILCLYTLVFAGVGLWAKQRPNLQLTARMLQVATLLIIPVNFWMIDGFRLVNTGTGLLLGGLAALSLTALTLKLLASQETRLTMANAVGLSWLHLGWQLAATVPLMAVYVGTIGTAWCLTYQSGATVAAVATTVSDRRQSATTSRDRLPQLPLGLITLIAGMVLLMGRAVLAVRVPVSDLGLAVGITGWLSCWLVRRQANQQLWNWLGAMLLTAGWGMAVTRPIPWSAIAVSGLALMLLGDRLRRYWQAPALAGMFCVGLQLLWLIWRVLPAEFRTDLIQLGTQLAGTAAMPWAWLGVVLLPYLWLTVGIGDRLRSQHPTLANLTELLGLALGIPLTLVSLANPILRVVNLTLSTFTLITITQRRSAAASELIYLTHVVGLGAMAAVADRLFPNLDLRGWIWLLMGGAVLEWGFSALPQWPRCRHSAWYLGLGLAGIGYLFLLAADVPILSLTATELATQRLVGLVAPTVLALLSRCRHSPQPTTAAWLSTISMVTMQLLLWPAPTARLVGLAVGTATMAINTWTLQHTLTAVLTVFLGLLIGADAIWQLSDQWLGYQITTLGWTSLGAIAPLLLWTGYHGCRRLGRRSALLQAYQQATDSWAAGISGVMLIILTAYTIAVYTDIQLARWGYVLAAVLLSTAIAYRIWLQATEWGNYGLAVGVELVVATAMARLFGSWQSWAIATLVLAILTQLGGDYYLSRHRLPQAPRAQPGTTPSLPRSWHTIPLLYALLGMSLGHVSFTATTGLHTLVLGGVAIGIGRRQAAWKLLSDLGLLTLSIAAYEGLIYQLSQTKGSQVGDGLTLLAGLAAAIALLYALLSPHLAPWLGRSAAELIPIGHVHWLLGTGLAGLSLLSGCSDQGGWIWMGVTAVLSVYALWQGRQRQAGLAEAWVYVGVAEGLAVISYGLHRVAPDSLLLDWGGAIAAALAGTLYLLPWATWGWHPRPWRRSTALLPGVILLLTLWDVVIPCLLLVGVFYAWLARVARQVRLSYISVVVADWALIRIFADNQVTEPLWYVAIFSGSLLYLTEIDPDLRSPTEREKRHWLRLLSTGLLCLTAMYQAGNQFWWGMLTIGLGLAVVWAGLLFRVRAFAYIGTVTFVIQVLHQVWLFTNQFYFDLWVIGLVVGIVLILIAANFESRRSQLTTWVEYLSDRLQDWD